MQKTYKVFGDVLEVKITKEHIILYEKAVLLEQKAEIEDLLSKFGE
jgi:hypothetical protein